MFAKVDDEITVNLNHVVFVRETHRSMTLYTVNNDTVKVNEGRINTVRKMMSRYNGAIESLSYGKFS